MTKQEFIDKVVTGSFIKHEGQVWECYDYDYGFMYWFRNTNPKAENCQFALIGLNDGLVADIEFGD